MKPTYVYRLDIEYPQISGALLAIWDGICEEKGWYDGDSAEPRPFSWPAERKFLSKPAASSRKQLLERLGAKVEVVQSLPVEWPGGAS
jgi:hypothetical protein